METDCKKCFRCRNFSRYFTKGVKKFNETNLGWCGVNQSTVKSNGCCDKYVIKTRINTVSKYVWYTLNDILTQISELRKIIEDSKGERETDGEV